MDVVSIMQNSSQQQQIVPYNEDTIRTKREIRRKGRLKKEGKATVSTLSSSSVEHRTSIGFGQLHNLALITCLLLLLNYSHRHSAVNGLKINSIGVPSAIANSSHVVLSCDYDLQGDQLYSVKWYKDYVEFYRYQPDYTQATILWAAGGATFTTTTTTSAINSDDDFTRSISPNLGGDASDGLEGEGTTTTSGGSQRSAFTVPQIASKFDYDLDGIYLNLALSNATHAYLSTTNLKSEGTYKCEVSVDGPSFSTVSAERQMKIYVLPKSKLVIYNNQLPSRSITVNHNQQHHLTGPSSSPPIVYDMNETINLTCSIGPSKPRTTLEWYINDLKAPEEYIFKSSQSDSNNDDASTTTMTSLYGLGSSSSMIHTVPADSGVELTLIFRLAPHHLKYQAGSSHQHSSQMKSLKLKCVAIMSLEFNFESNVIVAGGKTIKRQSMASSSVGSISLAVGGPFGGASSSSAALPLMMLRSPKTFSHDPFSSLSSLTSSSPSSSMLLSLKPNPSIYLWPQESSTTTTGRGSSSIGWRSSHQPIDSTIDSAQRIIYLHNGPQIANNHNNEPPTQTPNTAVTTNGGGRNHHHRDFMVMNSKDFLLQQQQLELNKHINHIQQILAWFAPNEASQPIIEGVTHKLSNEDYELNDIIQLNCSWWNHIQIRPMSQTHLKWFINNQEIVGTKINRYSNNKFYYERPEGNGGNEYEQEDGTSRAGSEQVAGGSTVMLDSGRMMISSPHHSYNRQHHHRHHHQQPIDDRRSYGHDETSLADMTAGANKANDQLTASTMLSASRTIKSITDHQQMYNGQQLSRSKLAPSQSTNTTPSLPRLPSSMTTPMIIGNQNQNKSLHQHNQPNSFRPLSNEQTMQQPPSEEGPHIRVRRLPAGSPNQVVVDHLAHRVGSDEQLIRQGPNKQTIPLQLELDNSLYQLKELDIKCLLVVEQRIVEYNAQLTITNTPNFMAKSSNHPIGGQHYQQPTSRLGSLSGSHNHGGTSGTGTGNGHQAASSSSSATKLAIQSSTRYLNDFHGIHNNYFVHHALLITKLILDNMMPIIGTITATIVCCSSLFVFNRD